MSCGNPNQPVFLGIMSAQFNVVDRFLTGVLFFEVFIYGEGLELSDWGEILVDNIVLYIFWVVATQTFFIFTPKIGEDEPILTNIWYMSYVLHFLGNPFVKSSKQNKCCCFAWHWCVYIDGFLVWSQVCLRYLQQCQRAYAELVFFSWPPLEIPENVEITWRAGDRANWRGHSMTTSFLKSIKLGEIASPSRATINTLQSSGEPTAIRTTWSACSQDSSHWEPPKIGHRLGV